MKPRRETAGAFFRNEGRSENPAAVAKREDEPCGSIGSNLFTYLSY